MLFCNHHYGGVFDELVVILATCQQLQGLILTNHPVFYNQRILNTVTEFQYAQAI